MITVNRVGESSVARDKNMSFESGSFLQRGNPSIEVQWEDGGVTPDYVRRWRNGMHAVP